MLNNTNLPISAEFNFQIEKKHQKSTGQGNLCARRGKIQTPHGCIQTPAFIFCATKGYLKNITAKQLKES